MKTLNSIRYILFAFVILGFFANFAQDGYWLQIAFFSTFLLAIVSFCIVVGYVKNIWKRKKSSTTFFMIFFGGWIAFILLIPLGLTLSFIKKNFEDIVSTIMLIMVGALLIEMIWVIIENWKLKEASNRFLALENIGMFLLLGGYAFKLNHYPGANPMVIFSLLLFLFLYLFKAFKQLFSEFKNGRWIAVLSFLFYLNLFFAVIGWGFKTQHFPGGRYMILPSTPLLVLLLIPLLLNLKFWYGKDKISFGAYLKKGSPIFLFIYINFLVSIYLMQALNIGPKLISPYPYVYQKMMDGTYKLYSHKSAEEYNTLTDTYIDNYGNFMNNPHNWDE